MKLRGKAVRAVGIALVLVGVTAIPAAATTYGVGWDSISCSPSPAAGHLALIPLNNGAGRTTNPCLSAEIATANSLGQTIDLYTNGADPGPSSPNWPGDCAGSTTVACASEYGTGLAVDAIGRATGVLSGPTFWWIDVESQNDWNLGAAQNVAVIGAMIKRLQAAPGLVSGVGIYSSNGTTTDTNWAKIAGADKTSFKTTPLWSSSPDASQATAQGNCSLAGTSFAGGPVVLTQFGNGTAADGDVVCPPIVTASAPKSGAHYTIKGTGFPGSTVSVVVRETDRTDPAKVTTVSASGNWSITATARYNATVTASNTTLGGSSPLGAVKVTPVAKPKLSAGACSVTVSGSITPYATGEGVSLATKGHGSVSLKVTKNKAGAGVIAKKTIHEACGTKVLVAITTSGKAKGKTYSQALTTSKWTTVRTKA